MVSISVKLNEFKSLLKQPVFAISLKDFLLYLFFSVFQILWLLLCSFLLAVELSVIIFGVWAGRKGWHSEHIVELF